MSLDAIALVRIPASRVPKESLFRALDDGALVALKIPFSSDPEAFLDVLDDVLEDALDEHDDPRGVLVYPTVANTSGTTYGKVVEEVGEGGDWIDLQTDVDPMNALQAMMGQVMGAIGPETLAGLGRAMSSVDPAQLEKMKVEAQGALAGGQMPAGGLDLNSPELRAAVQQMAGELQKNPALLEQLGAQLFGGAQPDEEDQEDEETK